MRLLYIVCEANIEERVLHELIELGCPGYTRFTGAIGFGSHGRREGSPVWPGLNTLVLSVVPDEKEQAIVEMLNVLKLERGTGLALRAFSTEALELL